MLRLQFNQIQGNTVSSPLTSNTSKCLCVDHRRTHRKFENKLSRDGGLNWKVIKASSNGKNCKEVTLDSGAIQNVVNNINYFRTLKKLRRLEVHPASSAVIYETNKGTKVVELPHVTLLLTNVIYVRLFNSTQSSVHDLPNRALRR